MKPEEKAAWLEIQKGLSASLYGATPIHVWGPAASVIDEIYEALFVNATAKGVGRVEAFWDDYFYTPTVFEPQPLHFAATTAKPALRRSILAGARYPHVKDIAPGLKPIGLPARAEYFEAPGGGKAWLVFTGRMSAVERDQVKSAVPGGKFDAAADAIFGESMKRLYTASVVWLFYFEQMGTLRLLGALLDDFATRGRWAIKFDSAVARVLEYLVSLTKMGVSSTVRDRTSTYRRCLGWTTEEGRKLALNTEVNAEFSKNFHRFLQLALEYYKDKRLAYAIQAGAAPSKPSVATVTAIGATLELLRQSREKFEWGRNHTNTAWGVLWVVIALALARELRPVFGAADSDEPSRYLARIYAALGLGKEEDVLYTERLECAESGRSLLLDLQYLDLGRRESIEAWLNAAEDEIEKYRTAYLKITGVDLGAGGTPAIPQEV